MESFMMASMKKKIIASLVRIWRNLHTNTLTIVGNAKCCNLYRKRYGVSSEY